MPSVNSAPGTPLTFPDMGTYLPQDVSWLVRDITDQVAESGWEGKGPLGPHNANLLAVESPTPPEHDAWFAKNTTQLAPELAITVGVLAELALAGRGPDISFASIIRAGVPAAVLAHRWLTSRHGLAAPHYAISLVPGDGIDQTALAYLAQHHDPEAVVFVDSWTGRGNIALEVAACVERYNRTHGMAFNPELAVLVDYSQCSTLFGTRQDMLIPSACLSTTSTGLTSKTVLNPEWVTGGHFHGVARYPQFAPDDRSRWYVDTIAARFEDVQDAVDEIVSERLAGPPPQATMYGRYAADALARRFYVEDPRRIKAGVGESTRLLLVNDVDLLLVRPDAGPAVAPILELAAGRNIPVRWDDTLDFLCAGISAPIGRIG